MSFPSFDSWLKENLGDGLHLTREELSILHIAFEKEKLFAEEGELPDEAQLHETHE